MRISEVIERTSLHRTMIYRLMAKGLFPVQKKIPGVRAATWSAADVEAYIVNIAK